MSGATIPNWLWEKHAERCFYCGHPLFGPVARARLPKQHTYILSRYGLRGGTRDHIVPRASGGTNARENLVLAYTDCNTKKAASPQSEFRVLFLLERGQDFYGVRDVRPQRDWLCVSSSAYVKQIVAYNAFQERQGYA